MGWVQAFDVAVLHWLNQFAGQSPAVDNALVDWAGASLPQGGVFLIYFWWLWFAPVERVPACRKQVAAAILGAILAVFVARVLQLSLPWHTRPLHWEALGFRLPDGVNPQTLSRWGSFPSDHAVLFFAFATAVWRQSRGAGIFAFSWALFAICLPRVYLGYHYPSDVIGGAIIGIVLMLVCLPLFETWPGDRVIGWATRHQALFYAGAFAVTYELAVLFFDIRYLAVDFYHIVKAISAA